MASLRTVPALVLLALASSGCGGIGSYCADRTECEGGSESDLEACEIVFETRADRADLEGCIDKFDEYFDCLSDSSVCEDDEYRAPDACSELDDQLSQCEAQ